MIALLGFGSSFPQAPSRASSLLDTSVSQAHHHEAAELRSSPCKLIKACSRQRARVVDALEERSTLNGSLVPVDLQPVQSFLYCSLDLLLVATFEFVLSNS